MYRTLWVWAAGLGLAAGSAVADTAPDYASVAELAVKDGAAARGEYLVRGPMGCGNCHTPQGPEGPDASRELAGFAFFEDEAMTAVAANITPGGRIAAWSDAELARAIREGVRPDGSVIGPPMPILMYRGLGDEDLAAVVAFLRTLPAIDNDPGQSEYRMPLPPSWGPPVASVAPPEPGPTAEYGAYLAGPVAHCLECHTPMGPQGPMFDTALGVGGFQFPGPWGVSVAPNITSSEDGLAGYGDDEIRAMITRGARPDGSSMLPPMPYGHFAAMSDDDLTAIVAYLRTMPPLPDAD
jgi:mono/diheme cytochrome c family protein